MIVTAWVIPPLNPHAPADGINPGIQRVIVKEIAEGPTSFQFDIEVRLLHAQPVGTRVEFGPVSETGFTRIRMST